MTAPVKNRILLPALVGLLVLLMCLVLVFRAGAVESSELSSGMTMQPGSEISVPDSSTEYSFSFYAGSCGALAAPKEGIIAPGETLILPDVDGAGLFVDEGYEFAGWYCTCDGQKITISAQYSAQPDIRFTENAVKYGLSSDTERMAAGKTVTVRVAEEYAPYIVSVTANGTEAVKDGDGYSFTMPDGSVTVDAVLSKNACVAKFRAGGGSFPDGTEVVTVLVPLENGKGAVAMPEAPQREYYNFTGWYTESGDPVINDSAVINAQPFTSVVYTARWEVDPEAAMTVTLDPAGGTVLQDSLITVPGEPVTLPLARMDRYTFLGWNTAANGSGDNYGPGEQVQFTKSMTLYAMWQAADCTVTVSVRQAGSAVGDLDSAVLIDELGGQIRGEGDGNGIFVFRSVPDGQYSLKLTLGSREGVYAGITVSNGKAVSCSVQIEMW